MAGLISPKCWGTSDMEIERKRGHVNCIIKILLQTGVDQPNY